MSDLTLTSDAKRLLLQLAREVSDKPDGVDEADGCNALLAIMARAAATGAAPLKPAAIERFNALATTLQPGEIDPDIATLAV